MFALSLYSVSHKFTLALAAHKGKSKGKKIPQHDITECGNRRTMTYVRMIIIIEQSGLLLCSIIVSEFFPQITVPAWIGYFFNAQVVPVLIYHPPRQCWGIGMQITKSENYT